MESDMGSRSVMMEIQQVEMDVRQIVWRSKEVLSVNRSRTHLKVNGQASLQLIMLTHCVQSQVHMLWQPQLLIRWQQQVRLSCYFKVFQVSRLGLQFGWWLIWSKLLEAQLSFHQIRTVWLRTSWMQIYPFSPSICPQFKWVLKVLIVGWASLCQKQTQYSKSMECPFQSVSTFTQLLFATLWDLWSFSSLALWSLNFLGWQFSSELSFGCILFSMDLSSSTTLLGSSTRSF